MARVLSRSNRPIIIQEPQSGLDTFLTEIAKYASPEYQQQRRANELAEAQQKRNNERADARLELEERRQQQNEQSYSDSLIQQDIINARNKTKAEQETKIFEDNQEINKRNNANIYLENQLDGLSPSDIVNLNKDSILAGLTDPFERQIASKVFDNTMNKSKSAVKIIDTRYKNFMEKNPDSNLSRIEAESVFSDEKVYKDYIVESYLVKKPDLTPLELKRLDFYSKRQVSLEKNLLKYQEMEQAGVGDQKDNISNVQADIDLNNLNIENILKLNQNTGTSSTDPYAKTTALSPFSDEYLGDVSRLYAGNEPSYDILFRQDSDDINIAEPALQLATENASQNNDIVYSDRLDESAPPATEEGGLDLVESREDGEKLGVPKNILDNLFPPSTKAQTTPQIFKEQEGILDLFDEELKKAKRPNVTPPSSESDIEDVTIEPLDTSLEDFSNLRKANPPTLSDFKSLDVKDSQGNNLNLDSAGELNKQLSGLYKSITGKQINKVETQKTNKAKDFIKILATGSQLKGTDTKTKNIRALVKNFLRRKGTNMDKFSKFLNRRYGI